MFQRHGKRLSSICRVIDGNIYYRPHTYRALKQYAHRTNSHVRRFPLMITSKDTGKNARLFAKAGNGRLYYLAQEPDETGLAEVNGKECRHMPNLNTRDIVYIVGPSGSGKSTYAAEYAKAWRKIYPEGEFVLFSKLDKDKVLDKLEPHRVDINESLVTDPINIMDEGMKNALLMFDDIDTLYGPISDAVYQILSDVLELGRHRNLYAVVCCHQIRGHNRTLSRRLLNEMTSLTLFPAAGRGKSITDVLTNEFDFGRMTQRKLFAPGSRWVTLFPQAPRAYLRQDGFGLI